MKRHKRLFEQVCSFENLLLAAHRAQRGKRFAEPAARFNHNLERELLRLQDELTSRAYRPGPFRLFEVRDPKPRVISAAPYRDRVVHHAFCNVVEPIFDRTFIHDTYACRTGKGTHAAVDRLTRYMQGADYALKCDIRLYFHSVDHAILKKCLRRKIGCEGTLWLADLIVGHSPPPPCEPEYFQGDNLFTPYERARGLPIGNQTSQFFANVYLSGLDHFVKERLRQPRYIRYVDDMVVLADDRRELWAVRDAIAQYLCDERRLRLHPRKVQVGPVTLGVDFLGYRVYPAHRLIRRASVLRFQRFLRRTAERVRSGALPLSAVQPHVAAWIGHARHADTYGLRTALFERVAFGRA